MEVVSGSNIPPISSLPQWPRFGVVERSVPPRQQRDARDVLPMPTEPHCERCGAPISGLIDASSQSAFTGIDVQELAKHLDKSIQFLKLQQNELLSGLHDEVDKLKRENRDLQYKLLTMANAEAAEAAKAAKAESVHKPPDVLQDQLIKRLRQEVDDLKTALDEAKQKNGLLEKIIDQQSTVHGASMDDIGDDPQQHVQLQMHTRALEHCDRIIKHLQLVNENQALEVTRLKAELKELLATYRPAPDVGLLSNRNKMLADSVRLPKLAGDLHSHRPFSPDVIPALNVNNTSTTAPSGNMVITNGLIPRPPSQPPPVEFGTTHGTVVQTEHQQKGSNIHLPPLKQVVPTRIAERKKQIDVLHKARLRQLSSNATNNNNNNNGTNTNNYSKG